jgi:hypothetical protein
MSMEVLGTDGARIVLTDQEVKDREAHLQAKVMAAARKRGIVKAQYKGMIKGEPIFGEPLDGFSDEALGLMETIAQKHGKPSLVQPVIQTVQQPEQTVIQQEVKPRKIDVAKDIFGF